MRLHHVQVSCPPGGEVEARRFYAEGLGLTEVEKPAALRTRGGAWFRSYAHDSSVSVELHVGVDESFVPAHKAHPAFVVDESQRDTFPSYLRLHAFDGHGNRIEFLQEQTL